MYFTYSLKPIENEAVNSEALRNWSSHIILIDHSKYLPELIVSNNLTQWNTIGPHALLEVTQVNQ